MTSSKSVNFGIYEAKQSDIVVKPYEPKLYDVKEYKTEPKDVLQEDVVDLYKEHPRKVKVRVFELEFVDHLEEDVKDFNHGDDLHSTVVPSSTNANENEMKKGHILSLEDLDVKRNKLHPETKARIQESLNF